MTIILLLIIVGALGEGINEVLHGVGTIFRKRVEREKFIEAKVAEVQKTFLMDRKLKHNLTSAFGNCTT